MEFDYRKLRGRIKEVFETQDCFAKALGIGKVSLSRRLNNLLEFSGKEIYESCMLLEIPTDEIPIYFFNPKVQESEPKKQPEKQPA